MNSKLKTKKQKNKEYTIKNFSEITNSEIFGDENYIIKNETA